MTVTYYQLNKSTTSIPTVAGTAQYVDGFYGVNGTLEYLIGEIDLSIGGTEARTTDLSALVKSMKITINGDIIHDWISGSAPEAGSAIAGRYGYFINSHTNNITIRCDYKNFVCFYYLFYSDNLTYFLITLNSYNSHTTPTLNRIFI